MNQLASSSDIAVKCTIRAHQLASMCCIVPDPASSTIGQWKAGTSLRLEVGTIRAGGNTLAQKGIISCVHRARATAAIADIVKRGTGRARVTGESGNIPDGGIERT